MSLDVRTLLVVMLLSNLLMAAALWVALAGRFRDGLAQWTASLCASAVSWLLVVLRGSIPDFLSTVGASMMAILSLSLQVVALLQFHQQRVPRWLWIVPVPTVAIAMIPFLDNLSARIIVAGAIFGPALIATGMAVLRFAHATPRTRRVMAGSFLVSGVLVMSRAIVVIFEPAAVTNTLTAHPAQWSLFLIGYAASIASSFGFLLMHQERADAETRRLATIDPLTGVFNRRTFMDLAERELARAHRLNTALSLLLLDIDHFKQVNDTHGHLAGDHVLIAFAKLVQHCLRREDLVMRYGGEEFCVLLPGIDGTAAQQLAERIRAQVEAMPVVSNDATVSVTVSGGLATNRERERITDMLARADEALYRAKRTGRNRIVSLTAANTRPQQSQQGGT